MWQIIHRTGRWMRRCAVVLWVAALTAVLPGCSVGAKIAAGDASYRAGEYRTAADIYRKWYAKLGSREAQTEVIFRMAECYRLSNLPQKAEAAYKRISNRKGVDPVVFLYLAECQKKNGKYEDAVASCRKYMEAVPDDARGTAEYQSCLDAAELAKRPTPYVVELVTQLNTRFNDFSPMLAASDGTVLYFTSSRDNVLGRAVHGATNQKFTDLFVSTLRNDIWSVPRPVSGAVNTEDEEGSCSFAGDFTTMYFTRCRQDKTRPWGCQLLVSELSNEVWGKAQELHFVDDTVTVSHPAISSDALTLYFVSDMPGGMGGKDIWRTVRSDAGEAWSAPVNLGETINTAGDEMFPYVRDDGTLYFSSDGNPGLGGLDIFKAVPSETASIFDLPEWEVQHMGAPLNSSADDFGITFAAGREAGFFSSTRSSRGDDNIYAFHVPEASYILSVSVQNARTGEAMPSVRVDMLTNDGQTRQFEADAQGQFTVELLKETDYLFMTSQSGFLKGKLRESTAGRTGDTGEITLAAVIRMTPTDRPIEVPDIFYDFADWRLRPESQEALNRLVEIMQDNDRIVIELASHTDSRGTDEFNQELSQRRAQSVVDYLIARGIPADRMQARGYGESVPRTVDAVLAEQTGALQEGAVLTEAYIETLPDETAQEAAHQFNRRTEFTVIRELE
ncbi:MAG: OmpA family protein [Bacteroidales bacterium]|nr:OmpA family protein [Bacteroidales bacterium]